MPTRASLATLAAVALLTVAPPGASPAPGLSCAQMRSQGYSYAAAVAAWRSRGYPASLDADSNGIPCETVYTAAEVRSYWAARARGTVGLPSGLFCRDLVAQGYSYGAALTYWRLEGYPARMDADGNGIPCETVYTAAEVRRYFRLYG